MRIRKTEVIIYHFTPKKMRNDMHLYETSYWVSPIPSTGCSKVRSPDSFTELNVFDFTYLTIFFQDRTLYQRPLLLNRLVRDRGLYDSIE